MAMEALPPGSNVSNLLAEENKTLFAECFIAFFAHHAIGFVLAVGEKVGAQGCPTIFGNSQFLPARAEDAVRIVFSLGGLPGFVKQ